MAFASGWPLARSQSTVVSRWFAAIPIAATSRALTRASASTWRAVQELGLPEQLRVVLDPAWLRIVLGVLLPGHPP